MKQDKPCFLLGVCWVVLSQSQKADRGTVSVSLQRAVSRGLFFLGKVGVGWEVEAQSVLALLPSDPHAPPQLLSSVLTVALSGKCDEESLHLLLTFPNNEKSWFATRELCSLPGTQVFSLLVMMGQNLNLRNFVYKVRTESLGEWGPAG